MERLRGLAALLAGIAVCGPASAVIIEFVPASGVVTLGSQFGVEIVVSDLHGPAGPEIVSAFDVDVLYDTAYLSGVDFLFSDALGLPNVDTLAFGFFDPGRIDLANLSLLGNNDLFALQGDSFVLGRLIFDAIGIGSSLLSFDTAGINAVNLVGSNPFASLPVTANSASINVTGATRVPEPSGLALLSIGLLAAGVVGKARRERA
jgi:hypothetical protein